jgi:hypothetical protein
MNEGTAMNDRLSTEISVKRRVQDGWYVYTCDQLPGLLVASRDDGVAYNDVPKSIQNLMKLDYNLDCLVFHKVEYREFISRSRLRERAHQAVEDRTHDMMSDSFQFTLQEIPSMVCA